DRGPQRGRRDPRHPEAVRAARRPVPGPAPGRRLLHPDPARRVRGPGAGDARPAQRPRPAVPGAGRHRRGRSLGEGVRGRRARRFRRPRLNPNPEVRMATAAVLSRDVLFFSTPVLWPCWPFLPVVRRTGDTEELGLMYDAFGTSGVTGYSASVFAGNLFDLPP